MSAAQTLQTGLIGYFPLDLIGTATVLDHSRCGHHLRNSATAILHPTKGGLDCSAPTATKVSDWAGASAFRQVQDFAICFEINLDADGGTLLTNEAPLTPIRSWRLSKSNGGTYNFLFSTNGTTIAVERNITGTSPVDAWVRVYFSKDSTGTVCRVTGAAEQSDALTAPLSTPSTTTPISFGVFPGATASGRLDGAIRNVMVWNRALTSGERDDLFDDSWKPGKIPTGSIKVFAVAGQSNGSGEAATPIQTGTFATAFDRRNVLCSTNRSTYVGFTYPRLASRSVAGIGMELGIGSAMPANSAIVSHCIGGTNLHTDWAATGGTRFNAWKSKITATKADLEALGYSPVVDCVIWDQGTGDTNTEENADAYEANLNALFSAMRLHVANEKCKFVIVKLDDEAYVSYPFLETVRAAQQAVADDDSRVAIIEQGDITKVDHVHRDAWSQTIIGERAVLAGLAIESQSVLTSVELADLAEILERSRATSSRTQVV